MATNSILPPYPTFFDTVGDPLEAGYIYVGQPGFEARSAPKASFFDLAMSIPTGTSIGAAVRTLGGYPARLGAATAVYVDGDFSITVTDKNDVLVFSALNRTFAFGISGTEGLPVQAPDGDFAIAGFGFIAEPSTGFVRQGDGVMQSIALGQLIWQQDEAKVTFYKNVEGPGFVSGVGPALSTALSAVQGDMIYRDASGLTRRSKGAAGQVLRQNDALTAPVWTNPIWQTVREAMPALTLFEWAGIPAWATRVTLVFDELSLSANDNFLVQLGTGAGFVVTGYSGSAVSVAAAVVVTANTSGFQIAQTIFEDFSGHLELIRSGNGSNNWVQSHAGGSAARAVMGGGKVALAAALTSIRLTRTGTDTFDGGNASIMWE